MDELSAPRPTSIQTPNGRRPGRKPAKRRTLSCYPCRKHKLKCDRLIPCQSCMRYQREAQCEENPAPSALPRVTSRQPPPDIAPGCGLAHKRENDFMLEVLRSPLEYSTTELVETLSSRNRHTNTSLLRHSWLALPAILLQTWPAVFLSSEERRTYSSSTSRPMETKIFFKVQLASLVPPREVCDRLVSYYIENIDLVYHSIHIPSFQGQYDEFWSLKVGEIDFIWLALLLTIISLAALMTSGDCMEILGIAKSTARDLAHVWHQASRQALYAGDFESKPTLTQLQVFLCTQIYWLETKNHETLNSALGQAVRNAQALGLDKNRLGKDCLETELRRRVWWELVICDVYQAMSLGRPSLIHTSSSEVPKPVHCNDIDITETTVVSRPVEEITDMSASIARIEVFSAFRRLFDDNRAYTSSYEYVRSVDSQISDVVYRLPWYFQIHNRENISRISDTNTISWQHIILHVGVCLQRIRLNIPFLHARVGESWIVCAKVARDIFVPYRQAREASMSGFLTSQKSTSLRYQVYTGAVAVAAFLLVERSLPGLSPQLMIQDIQMVISDLEMIDLGTMLADGVKVLRKMLGLFEQGQHRDEYTRTSLAKEIASVFGGEELAKKYLKSFHDNTSGTGNEMTNIVQKPMLQPITAGEPDPSLINSAISFSTENPNVEVDNSLLAVDEFTSMDFEIALDMLSFNQWFDHFITGDPNTILDDC